MDAPFTTTRRSISGKPQRLPQWLSQTLHLIARLTSDFGEGTSLLLVNLGYLLRGNFRLNRAMEQYYALGARSAFIVAVSGLFVGMVLTLQIGIELARFGASVYVATINCVAILRELGPILTGLLLSGRAASGITAEIAAMQVTEQIQAMRMLNLDLNRNLITPRLFACILSAFALTVVFDLLALVGGYAVALSSMGLTFQEYHFKMIHALKIEDVAMGLLKSIVFGAIIASVGCFYGLKVRTGARGVGEFTRRSVVTASLFIIISDFFAAKLLLAVFGMLSKVG